MEKKQIDLQAKKTQAELKIHAGVSRQAASEISAELNLHSAIAQAAMVDNNAAKKGNAALTTE